MPLKDNHDSVWVPVLVNGRRIGTARVDSDGIINVGIAGKAASSLFRMLSEGESYSISVRPNPTMMKETEDA